MRGRLVSCSPSRICCLASLRTELSSAWGASVGPPTGPGHAGHTTCAHQCPQQHQLELDSGTHGLGGEQPRVRSGGPWRTVLLPVESGCVEANEEDTQALQPPVHTTLGQG